jgi:outer membrane protein TolC
MLSLIGVLGVLLAQAAPMQLSDCITEALARHPDVAVVRTGIDLARTEQKGARASYLPSLSVQSSDAWVFSGRTEGSTWFDSRTGVVLVRDPQEASVNDTHGFGIYLQQPVFDGLGYWVRPKRAAAAVRSAELDVVATREQVTQAVIEAYYRLLGQQSALEVLQEAQVLSQAQLELAEERHRLGAASRVDVSLARLAVGEDRIGIERQSLAIAHARVGLNRAMGRPAGDPIEVAGSQELVPPEAASLTRRVQADHVLLERKRLALDLAELDVSLSATALWPRVTASASYSRNDPEFYKVYSRFDSLFSASIGLNISYPIFEGFATQASIEAAEVRAERVRREREQVAQELAAGLAGAVAELTQLRQIQAVEQDNIRFAEDSLSLARERYEIGEGTAIEVRDAQLAVTRARLTQVQTHFDLQIALARYHQASGDLMATYLPEERP